MTTSTWPPVRVMRDHDARLCPATLPVSGFGTPGTSSASPWAPAGPF
ncbi:hypothetical protein AB0D86_25805 [Streptomyces sp. NPDC048324]